MKNHIDYLFVYGTLRRDSQNDMYRLLARHANYHCDGWFQGKLYNVSYYPGAVPSENPSDKVYGEIYKLNSANNILPKLDEYEECGINFPSPTEYVRELKEIKTSLNDPITCWIYIYNRSIDNLDLIPSGDFYKR